MPYLDVQASARRVWRLSRDQHDVVGHDRLRQLGYHPQAIKRRVASGRLHRRYRGVYAVGRPGLTQYGEWMAAVLACGPGAVLSHASAAALWEIRRDAQRVIEVSVPPGRRPRHPGIAVHRRSLLGAALHARPGALRARTRTQDAGRRRRTSSDGPARAGA